MARVVSAGLDSSLFTYVADDFDHLNIIAPQPIRAGLIAYVKNSQGTKWLPGGLGGNYYPSGNYTSNGTKWLSNSMEISNQFNQIMNSHYKIKDSNLTPVTSELIYANHGSFSVFGLDPAKEVIISSSMLFRNNMPTDSSGLFKLIVNGVNVPSFDVFFKTSALRSISFFYRDVVIPNAQGELIGEILVKKSGSGEPNFDIVSSIIQIDY